MKYKSNLAENVIYTDEGGPGSGQKGHTTPDDGKGNFTGGSHTPDPRAQAAFDKEQAEKPASEPAKSEPSSDAGNAERAAMMTSLLKRAADRKAGKAPRETQLQKWHRRNSSGYD